MLKLPYWVWEVYRPKIRLEINLVNLIKTRLFIISSDYFDLEYVNNYLLARKISFIYENILEGNKIIQNGNKGMFSYSQHFSQVENHSLI